MTALDKSLDEIISEKRIQTQRGGVVSSRDRMDRMDRDYMDRGITRESGMRRDRFEEAGPVRRSNAPRASSPYRRQIQVEPNEFDRAPRAVSAPAEARVRVEGLDPAWEAKDVREIFTEQGHNILRVFMHWDRSGRSEGSCEMTLESLPRARALVEDMDGAEVDGFPLAITLVRGQAAASSAPASAGPSYGRRDTFPRADREAFTDTGRSALRDEPLGGARGKGGPRTMPTKEELDAQLDRMRRDR